MKTATENQLALGYTTYKNVTGLELTDCSERLKGYMYNSPLESEQIVPSLRDSVDNAITDYRPLMPINILSGVKRTSEHKGLKKK